jgi:hypothetical protein
LEFFRIYLEPNVCWQRSLFERVFARMKGNPYAEACNQNTTAAGIMMGNRRIPGLSAKVIQKPCTVKRIKAHTKTARGTLWTIAVGWKP